MSDFLLDFRTPERRTVISAGERLRFQEHIQIGTISTPEFDLVVARPDERDVWGSCRNETEGRIVAVAGRVALDEAAWELGRRARASGGLACRAIDALYESGGLEAIQRLSGNFVIILWDGRAKEMYLVTDCTGVFPAYECETEGSLVVGSHPDVLASACGESENLDEVSLAEFAITSAVSPPFTYYRRLRHVGRAMTLAIRPQSSGKPEVARVCHFPLEFRGSSGDREDELAEEFAVAFLDAVRRRSLPHLGRCAVALSGGLDSRAVLSSVTSPQNTFAFTCYDRENEELGRAREIARAIGIDYFPWQRPFDYYGENAALGMRVSGGMGSIANNHFLGVLPWLREQGAGVLLTGCYCDYLFKGLALNRRSHPLTGRETLAPYRRDFYFTQFWPGTPLARDVRDRIDARFPETLVSDQSDAAVFELEQRRTFPLCYEADNAQRLVPQRLTGWFVPISDQRLMRLYCRIPYRWKLNCSLFRKAVKRLCGSAASRVPDANTGAPLDASRFEEVLSWTALRVRNRLRQLRPSIATSGSWPEWHFYIAKSRLMADLWARPNGEAEALFKRVLGREEISSDVHAYRGDKVWLLVPLLSLKLWMEQRLV
jgi:asparagine synthase (glutamine-hydrolysing)